MIINIYGPSGSGKNVFIKSLFEKKDINNKLANQLYSKLISIDHNFHENSSVSLLPINDFQGSVIEYLSLYGLTDINLNEEFFKSFFSNIDPDKFLLKNFNLLSMGERRRLDLWRSYLQNKKINFIDEPFANSDDNYDQTILSILKKLHLVIILNHSKLKNSEIKNIKIKDLV